MVSQHDDPKNIFHRNIESVLNERRQRNTFYQLNEDDRDNGSIDFSSLDVLSLSSTGTMREAYLAELAEQPNFKLSEGGSRLLINSAFTDAVESRIAAFHRAETALIFHSGWDANVGVLSTVPRPGDVIVYDELIHASMHEGLKLSPTPDKIAFRHNDVQALRDVLLKTRDTHPLIRSGQRCVLICIESMYSMDGDVAPLKQFVDVANEVYPGENAQFFIDEAHTTGLTGPQGSGLVCELGLEERIAVRMHTYGKAMACSGGGESMRNHRCWCSSLYLS